MSASGTGARIVGMVPLEGRGDLPFVLLHDEPLVLHGVRTLLGTPGLERVVVTVEQDGVERATHALGRLRPSVDVAEGRAWWRSRAAGPDLVVVLLDPLCPLVPADFVTRVLERAEGGAAAGYRPVTDTVKTVVDRQIVGTLDRDRLAIVTSPVVVPRAHTGHGRPPVQDFARLATWLRSHGDVTMVKAPSMARRLGDESAVRVLECLDELAHRVQEA